MGEKRWMIGTDRDREAGISGLSARLDDDDDNKKQ